jgi:hypothetical protein
MPRLSQADVAKAIAAGETVKLFDGNSLCLRIRGGSALWEYNYRDGQSMRTRCLGSAADMSPAAARRAREDFAAERRKGRIPRRGLANANKAEPVKVGRMRFSDVVESLITKRSASEWKVKSNEPHHYRRLKDGSLGKLWADEIAHHDVAAELQNRWGDALANAEKMRARIEVVLNHAIARGARPGDAPNPARKEIIKELVSAAPKSKPRAAMHRDGVPALMAELVADGSPVARAMAFAVLTGGRNTEARLADWSEVIGDAWIIPGGRGERSMKEQEEHAIPLSPAALALLGPRKASGLIFGRMYRNALLDKLHAMRPEVDASGKYLSTIHGFRTSFESWAKANGYSKELRELAKAHAAGRTATELAYDRYDSADQLKALRPMLQAWSDYVSSRLASEPG